MTGSTGFLGQYVCRKLEGLGDIEVLRANSHSPSTWLREQVKFADFIFHLAAKNRAFDEQEFELANRKFTESLTSAMVEAGKKTPILFSSTQQVFQETPYARSKKAAENAICRYGAYAGAKVWIIRFPNLFGSGARLAQNALIPKLSFNISRGLPVEVTDLQQLVHLMHVEDAAELAIRCFLDQVPENGVIEKDFGVRTYTLTIGEILSRLEHCNRWLVTSESPPFGCDFSTKLMQAFQFYASNEAI